LDRTNGVLILQQPWLWRLSHDKVKNFQSHRMALLGEFPSEDAGKRQEFFDASDGICAMKWKIGIASEHHIMCDCTRFWKLTVCQHSYHYKHGNPNLSNTKRAKKTGPKRTLKFTEGTNYTRGRYHYDLSGFSPIGGSLKSSGNY
jgi:hypothetical protein